MHAILHFLGLLLRPFAWLMPRQGGADLTTVAELLKEVYDPVIAEQQNLEAFTWNEFPDGTDKLGGQGWFFETKVGGNQKGIGSRAERGFLPYAGYQQWVQGKIYWKLFYGAFELTGPLMEAAKTNAEAFANAKTEEMEGLMRDCIKDLNRQVYGDGTGKMALVSEAASTGQAIFYVKDGMYLRSSQVIDVIDTGDGTTKNVDSGVIDTVEPASNATYPYRVKVTLTANITVAALAENDQVVREDSATSTTAGYDIEGLAKIMDDGTNFATYLNISRTTYPVWKGHYLDNSGTERHLSLDMIQQLEDRIVVASGKRPDWIRMNLDQRRKFFDLVAPDKRYMTGDIDGGYERLKYNGNTLTIDIDHPHGEISAMQKSVVKKYYLRRLGILDFDGLTLRQTTQKDVWIGFIGLYGNLGCKRCNCTGRILDLIKPTDEAWVY